MALACTVGLCTTAAVMFFNPVSRYFRLALVALGLVGVAGPLPDILAYFKVGSKVVSKLELISSPVVSIGAMCLAFGFAVLDYRIRSSSSQVRRLDSPCAPVVSMPPRKTRSRNHAQWIVERPLILALFVGTATALAIVPLYWNRKPSIEQSVHSLLGPFDYEHGSAEFSGPLSKRDAILYFFILYWERGQRDYASAIAEYAQEHSQERIAINFLLKGDSGEESTFRSSMPPSSHQLTEFIVAINRMRVAVRAENTMLKALGAAKNIVAPDAGPEFSELICAELDALAESMTRTLRAKARVSFSNCLGGRAWIDVWCQQRIQMLDDYGRPLR